MNYVSLSGIMIFISSLISALFVFVKNPFRSENITWGLFAFSVSLWGFGIFKAFSPAQSQSVLFWMRFLNMAAVWLPIFFYHFTMAFTHKAKKYKQKITGYYIIVSLYFLAALVFPDKFISSLSPKMNFIYYPNAGIMYYFFPVIFLGLVIKGINVLLKQRNGVSGFKKNQIKHLLFGIIPGFLGGATTFPLVFGIRIYPFGTYFVIIYVISAAYAIAKYRLMGIRTELRKLIVPIIVFLVSIVLFFIQPVILFKPEQVIYVYCALGVLFFTYWISGKLVFLYLPYKNYSDLLYDYSHKTGECQCADEVFERVIEVLQSAYGPRPKSAVILWQKIPKHEYVLQRAFGIKTQERLKLSYDCALIKFIESEYLSPRKRSRKFSARVNTKNVFDDVPVLIKDDLHKLYAGSKIDNVIKDLEELSTQVCIPLIYHENKRKYLLAVICLGDPEATYVYDYHDYEFFKETASQTARALVSAEARQTIVQMQRLAYLGKMAMGWANKMGNILNVISTSVFTVVEGLNSGCDRERVKACGQRAYETLHKAEKFIKYFLCFTHPVENKDFKKISLDKLCESAIEQVRAGGKLKNIYISTDTQKNLPEIDGVEDYLKEVLVSIIDNASDAVSARFGQLAGRVRVRIHISRCKRNIEIEIQDNGKGMSAEDINNLGTPLFMPDGGMGSSPKGEGMSMSIAYYYIQNLHKGRIRVESELGKGTIFHLSLPVNSK